MQLQVCPKGQYHSVAPCAVLLLDEPVYRLATWGAFDDRAWLGHNCAGNAPCAGQHVLLRSRRAHREACSRRSGRTASYFVPLSCPCGQRTNTSQGISQNPWRSAMPASSDIAAVPSETCPFVRRWRPRHCNGNCNMFWLRGVGALFSRIPQDIWRKSVANAASPTPGQNFPGQQCCPRQSPFRSLRMRSSTVPSLALLHNGNLRVILEQRQEWK